MGKMLISWYILLQYRNNRSKNVFIWSIFNSDTNLGHLALSKGLIGHIYGFHEEILSNSTVAPKFTPS